MKLPPPRRHLQGYGAALGVCVAVGFVLQLLGGPLWRSPPAAPQPPCRPRTHLVFLKTHKTGGSSVVNLLHRFGEGRGLRFALPHRYQFGYPEMFRAERVKGYKAGGPPFDIICHHMRFNASEVRRVMPADSFYFSIARDPATAAESAFSYYRAAVPAFRRAPSRSAFLLSPSLYYRPDVRGNHYARNLMWFDFGLPDVSPSNATAVAAAIGALERVFALVLLAEHFDESLVLLRHALCWPRDAVVAFAHNGRPEGSVRPLSRWETERLREWNALDWALYAHFNRSFWTKVAEFGPRRMREEVERLRRRREAMARRCLRGGGPLPAPSIPDGKLRPFQPGRGAAAVLGYALRADLGPADRERCERMATPELQYKDRLERKQFGGNGTAG